MTQTTAAPRLAATAPTSRPAPAPAPTPAPGDDVLFDPEDDLLPPPKPAESRPEQPRATALVIVGG